MKRLIFILLLIPLIGFGQFDRDQWVDGFPFKDTIYFNPNALPGGDGSSQLLAYDSISDLITRGFPSRIYVEDSTFYAFYAGSVFNEDTACRFDINDVSYAYFSLYGGTDSVMLTKDRGTLSYFASNWSMGGGFDHVLFKGIWFRYNGHIATLNNNGTTSKMFNLSTVNASNHLGFVDCYFSNSWVQLGDDGGTSGSIKDSIFIYNCVFDTTGLDNIFIEEVPNMQLYNSKFRNCNWMWHFPVDQGGSHDGSYGDNVHLGGRVDGLEVFGCTFNRLATGNKFCFIINGLTSTDMYAEFIGNTFRGPKDTIDALGGVAVALYDGSGTDEVLFERNYISGRADSWGRNAKAFGRIDWDTVYFNYNILDSLGSEGKNGASYINYQSCEYAEVYNNTIVSPRGGDGSLFQVGGTLVRVKNNLVAGNTTYTPLRIFGATTVDSSYNYQINSSNSNLYDAYLSITDWENEDYSRTSDLNDGINVGLSYDIDSTAVSNPPERGAYEFVEDEPDPDPDPDPPAATNNAVKAGGRMVKAGNKIIGR